LPYNQSNVEYKYMHKYPYRKPENNLLTRIFVKRWTKFWMRFGGYGKGGRLAYRLAALFVPPYKERIRLSGMNKKGFVEHTASIHHPQMFLGDNCFIGDRVVLYERRGGGAITFGNRVEINRDTLIETGIGGFIKIGDHSSIHPGGILFAYIEPIIIGAGVMIASNCCLYSYDHAVAPHDSIRNQAPVSKGPIVIGDEAWLAAGCVVMSGVSIGNGAVIGAGSIVTHDIPENAIAAGVPARVFKMRN